MGTVFVEVVLKGPRRRARGFVEGYLAGRGIREPVLDAEEEGFERETLRERLIGVLHPSTRVMHLLVPAPAVQAVREAAQASEARGIPAVVLETREIARASLEFSFAAFSREHGRRLLSLLDGLPEGVRILRDRPFEERIDPGALGIEAYAPAHEYEIRGEGTIEGDLEGVLAVRRRLREEDAIRLGRARLIAVEP